MEDTLFSWDLWFLKFTRTLETVRESLKPVWWFDHINGVYTKEKNMGKNTLWQSVKNFFLKSGCHFTDLQVDLKDFRLKRNPLS